MVFCDSGLVKTAYDYLCSLKFYCEYILLYYQTVIYLISIYNTLKNLEL